MELPQMFQQRRNWVTTTKGTSTTLNTETERCTSSLMHAHAEGYEL